MAPPPDAAPAAQRRRDANASWTRMEAGREGPGGEVGAGGGVQGGLCSWVIDVD